MDFKELKTKTAAELDRLITEQRGHLQALRFKVAAGQQKNVREIRSVRKLLARMLTLKAGTKPGADSGKTA